VTDDRSCEACRQAPADVRLEAVAVPLTLAGRRHVLKTGNRKDAWGLCLGCFVATTTPKSREVVG